jgi:hypothetical protein
LLDAEGTEELDGGADSGDNAGNTGKGMSAGDCASLEERKNREEGDVDSGLAEKENEV